MIFTLGDAVKKLKRHVDGGSCNRQRAVDRINEATEVLLDEAEWKDTVRRVRCKTFKSCLTLPREFEKVISVNIDNRAAHTFSQFYQYLEGGPQRTDGLLNRWSKDLHELGHLYPTFMEIPEDCDDYTLFAMSTEESDTNLTLRVYGKGPLSQDVVQPGGEIGEKIPISRWVDGIEGMITGSNRPTMGKQFWRSIRNIVKPVTKGYIALYAWNTQLDDFTMYYLSKYHPEETNPGYRRYQILGHDLTNGQCITMAVKIAYFPLVRDDEPLQIQSLSALKEMMLSFNASERDATALAAEHLTSALRFLISQRRNAQAIDNTINVQDEFGLGSVVHVQ